MQNIHILASGYSMPQCIKETCHVLNYITKLQTNILGNLKGVEFRFTSFVWFWII